METDIGYKVVRAITNNGTRRYSAIPSKYQLSYKEGEWKKPAIKGSMIYAFLSPQYARDFAVHNQPEKEGEELELWKIEIKGLSKEAALYPGFFDDTAYYRDEKRRLIESWWHKRKSVRKEDMYYYNAPYGSVLCEAIKLIEYVEIL